MEPEVLATLDIGSRRIEAVLADLTDEQVDAVVNAANSQLAHGGGLAAAIVRRGGQIIQSESDKVAPVPVGGAAVTTAGALPSTWVIHAVGPRWGEGAEESKLRSAVSSSLDRADECGAKSIALPAISTGIFGYPKGQGTRVIVDELLAWLERHPEAPLELIRLAAFDRTTAELFAAAVRASV